MSFLLVVAAALGAGTSTAADSLGELPFSVTADHVRASPRAGVFIAEGDVVVRRAGVVVRADRLIYEEAKDTAVAEGHVALVEAESILFCRRVEMKLPGLGAAIQDAELRVKRELSPSALESLDPASLREYGKDELILGARALDRTGERSWEIEGGVFTACDCGEGETPTWRVDAGSASIDLDSGAWLSWPVFYAKGVPVFALPAFYVPLGDRRSGLLMPRLGHSEVTGFRISEPLFLTFGESWDATIEAGFMFARGPTSALELRWAPADTARGVARLSLLGDFGTPDGEGGFTRAREDPFGRWAFSARHESPILEGAKLAADLNLVGDPAYVAELADAYLARQAETTASRVTITSNTEIVRVAGGVALIQDLRGQTYPPGDLREVNLFSSAIPGPGAVRQRFAQLRLDAFPHPLFGERSVLFGEARLVLDGFAAPSPEPARFARADLRPQVSLPISLFGFATLEPSIAGRFTAWGGRFEHRDESASRYALIARAALSTELGKKYGAWIHRVRPEVDYLMIPWVEHRGSAAFTNNDELDVLRTASQVRGRLVNDLLDAKTGRRAAGLDAWIGRDLEGGKTSELVLQADASVGDRVRLYTDAKSAIALDPAALTELTAGVGLGFGSSSMSARYGRFGSLAPEYSFIALEELVPSQTISVPWSAYQGIEVGATIAEALPAGWGRVTISSAVSLFIDPTSVRSTQTLVRWDSSCECFGVGAVVATARDRPGVDLVNVVIDLARLGQVTAQ